MTARETFRIAIRKFDPFESAIQKQWKAFESEARTGLHLEAVAFDLHLLQESLFAEQGLMRGAWDVAFINTDWVSAIYASGCVVDLSSYLRSNPPEDYPHGWTDSLLRLQNKHGSVLGLPYHDGPECFLYRKDLFEDPIEKRNYQQQFGSPLRPPRTWKEFTQIAQFFSSSREKSLRDRICRVSRRAQYGVRLFAAALVTRRRTTGFSRSHSIPNLPGHRGSHVLSRHVAG